MIVQFGQPSPWHVGQSSRRLYSPRSVGIGTSPRRCEIISSNSGLTLSYSLPSSARIGPRWNSTSSIAIFGTSAMRTRRIAFANEGSVSSSRRRIASGACDSTRIFISHPPAAAAAFRLRAVVRDRRHFLDPADPQAGAGERADRGLGSRSGRLRLVPSRRAHPDVDRVDAFLLRCFGDALRGLHRGVRRGLVLRRLGFRPLVFGALLCGLRRRRRRRLAVLPHRMEVARARGPLVVRAYVLVRAAHEDAGNRHATSADRHVPVDDELPRLSGREREALEERHRLQPPGEDGLDVEREDVVEARALERQQPEPAEPPEELLPFLLRLLVLLPDARLQFPRPLAEPPQDVLGSPEFLLVLQPVLLQELVLRLDALRLPRMGGPLVLRTRELRVAQRLTPSPVPSSLPSFLPSSLPSCRLPRPSSPWRLQGRPSS